jgi:CSLREA domain-containing protein
MYAKICAMSPHQLPIRGISFLALSDTRGSTRRATLLLFSAFFILVNTGWCGGAIYTVDSTNDASDAVPGDGLCNDGTGHCTLRAAIQEASAAQASSTNIINVPAGNYVTNTLLLASKIDAAKDLSIIGTGAAGTVIVDASGGTPHGVFNIGGGGTTSLVNLTIKNGTAFVGGGIGAYLGTLNISLCMIANNHAAAGGNSAGIFIDDPNAVVNLDRSTVSNNTSPNDGGGIGITQGTMKITSSALINNHASVSGGGGGGISNQATLSIGDSTISGNVSNYGGGIDTFGNGATTQLANVTLTGNSAQQLYLYLGTTSVLSSIIANPLSGANCAGAITSLGHNLDSANSCNFTAPSDVINTNPKLAPLANNGGPTFTHALLPGSPAIDQGDNFYSYQYDQRGSGFPRVLGAVADIGAFEDVQPDKIFAYGFEVLPPPGS